MVKDYVLKLKVQELTSSAKHRISLRFNVLFCLIILWLYNNYFIFLKEHSQKWKFFVIYVNYMHGFEWLCQELFSLWFLAVTFVPLKNSSSRIHNIWESFGWLCQVCSQQSSIQKLKTSTGFSVRCAICLDVSYLGLVLFFMLCLLSYFIFTGCKYAQAISIGT